MESPLIEKKTPNTNLALPVPAIICIAIGAYLVVIAIILLIRQALLKRGLCGHGGCCGKEGDPCCECCVSCSESVNCCRSPNIEACLDSICPTRRECCFSCYLCFTSCYQRYFEHLKNYHCGCRKKDGTYTINCADCSTCCSLCWNECSKDITVCSGTVCCCCQCVLYDHDVHDTTCQIRCKCEGPQPAHDQESCLNKCPTIRCPTCVPVHTGPTICERCRVSCAENWERLSKAWREHRARMNQIDVKANCAKFLFDVRQTAESCHGRVYSCPKDTSDCITVNICCCRIIKEQQSLKFSKPKCWQRQSEDQLMEKPASHRTHTVPADILDQQELTQLHTPLERHQELPDRNMETTRLNREDNLFDGDWKDEEPRRPPYTIQPRIQQLFERYSALNENTSQPIDPPRQILTTQASIHNARQNIDDYDAMLQRTGLSDPEEVDVVDIDSTLDEYGPESNMTLVEPFDISNLSSDSFN